MARSDYIYIVIFSNKPVAAFTVKRELISWLDNESPVAVNMFDIYRLRDNGDMDNIPVRLDKEKLINAR